MTRSKEADIITDEMLKNACDDYKNKIGINDLINYLERAIQIIENQKDDVEVTIERLISKGDRASLYCGKTKDVGVVVYLLIMNSTGTIVSYSFDLNEAERAFIELNDNK